MSEVQENAAVQEPQAERVKIVPPEQHTDTVNADNITVNVINAPPAEAAPVVQPEVAQAAPAPAAAIAPVPQPQEVLTAAPHNPSIVSGDLFKKAEENLAAYIGEYISAHNASELAQQMTLTLKNCEATLPTYANALELHLRGTEIEANYARAMKILREALQQHPDIAPLLGQDAPAITQPRESEGDNVIRTLVDGLTDENYAALVHAIATRQNAKPLVATVATAPLKDAEITAASAPIAAQLDAPLAPVAEAVQADAPESNVRTGTIHEGPGDEKPKGGIHEPPKHGTTPPAADVAQEAAAAEAPMLETTAATKITVPAQPVGKIVELQPELNAQRA